MKLKFITRGSTWLAVLSVLLTAFTALSTATNMKILAANAVLLAILICVARHEGRHA
jgi:hypothetical protein